MGAKSHSVKHKQNSPALLPLPVCISIPTLPQNEQVQGSSWQWMSLQLWHHIQCRGVKCLERGVRLHAGGHHDLPQNRKPCIQ